METIAVKSILPDENQPRKYFAADKMYQLRNSIKKHGIIQPIVVEDIGNGRYLLIDGERRFRAALELGLKEVPAVVEAPQKETDRLIRQFQVQEQHESWTPIEKAMSILSLAKALSASLQDVCKVLGVSHSDSQRYVAFAELADKEAYIKSEVPLSFAPQIRTVKNLVKNLKREEMDEEFNLSDEKKLEAAVVRQIVKGSISRKSDMARLGDAFKKKPELVDKFLKSETATPDSLFLEAKAKGAYHLRNLLITANYAGSHGKKFLETPDVKLDEEQVRSLKHAVKIIKDVIGLVE